MNHRAFLRSAPLLLTLTFPLVACGGDEPSAQTGGTSSSSSSSGGEGGQGGVGGGQGGAGGGQGGQGGGIAPGDPIVAPNEQWTWVPFDGAFCGNGTTTGIGVNPTNKSKKLVIYMMGGGACWDDLTCNVLKTAANLDGYDETKFQADAQGLLNSSLFDRTNEANPLKDYSFVFVPYCTGDVHAGDNVATYNGKPAVHHVGRKNMEAFLPRILGTWQGAERVILAGSSAGGFGVGMNWERVQSAFGSVRVDALDDAGPVLPNPYLSEDIEAAWRASWNLDGGLPAGCDECKTALDAMLSYVAANHPNSRGALLSSQQDQVIRQFMGFLTGPQYQEGLDALATTRIDPTTNVKYYFIPGEQHVLLSDPYAITQNGVTLISWLNQMINDDPTWKSVHP